MIVYYSEIITYKEKSGNVMKNELKKMNSHD